MTRKEVIMKSQAIGESVEETTASSKNNHRKCPLMSRMLRMTNALTIAVAILLVAANYAAAQQSPNSGDGNHRVHVQRPPGETGLGEAPSQYGPGGSLSYHGGDVMRAGTTTYAIFWNPPRLQDNSPTHMSPKYQSVVENMLSWYPGNRLGANNTQYYDVGWVCATYFCYWGKRYIQNTGSLGGAYVDASPYPASEPWCNEIGHPNCISDSQIQEEIQKVMTLKGWTAGINKMFLLFTSSGEEACSSDGTCTYSPYPNDWCGYHGSFPSGQYDTAIYAYVPYHDARCQEKGYSSPNNDPDADTAADAASHELTEAITDPFLDAWYQDLTGMEIGDLCAYNYGTNSYDGGKANQYYHWWFWWDYFELQMEWDNKAGNCVQAGP